jgi:NADP-dependent 3-hydroxy acid dehydrogenase YdfG
VAACSDHGHVDILINNAGRSIRRSVRHSYDRFHDFERTMDLNYFGALRLILGFLPGMEEQEHGHIINISSIGVLASPPRFSAYVASKAALDAFSHCAAPEYAAQNIAFHDHPHAPGAHADDRADEPVQGLPHAVAGAGPGPGDEGDHLQAQARVHASWA